MKLNAEKKSLIAIGLILSIALSVIGGLLPSLVVDRIGISLALIASSVLTYLAAVYFLLEKSVGQLEDKIFSVPDFEELDAEQFYINLDRLVRSSNSGVSVMYFGKRSPRTGTFRRQERNYIEMILRHPKERPEIYFRRIVLNTPSNLEWVRENMNALGDLPNFSLSVYNSYGKEPILSIQLVDDEHVFIVDPLPGEPHNVRYLYAKSRHANHIFKKYYQAIWEQSINVVDGGVKDDLAVRQLGLSPSSA